MTNVARIKTAAVVAAAVAILVGVVVLAVGGGRDTHSVTSPSGFDLPALTSSGRVRLSDYRGKPVVVNLFASWCAECRVELPAFARAATDLRGRVQFIGIDSLETGDGRAMAAEYHLTESGFVLGRDVGAGGSAFHDALHAPGMPVTIFYDRAGHIVGRDIASLPESLLRSQLHQFSGV
ncbi:MAG: TlpA disulfide reductase family protein [Acidimicrobiales bacterium]